MSTHAIIGIKYPSGSIDACYVHYDGHTAGKRIDQFLRQQSTTCLAILIQRAQSCGGIRSFHTPVWPSAFATDNECYTEFLDDNDPYIINQDNWAEEHLCAVYKYLVHYDTGTIECLKVYDDGT